MNITYFRTSTRSAADTVAEIKKEAEARAFSVVGVTAVPKARATIVTLCKPEWLEAVLAEDKNLVAVMPCTFVVMEKAGVVKVGAGDPALLRGGRSEGVARVASEAERDIKSIVNAAAGVGDLKPSKVRLFSTMSCPYCKMEKEWLESKNVPHEVTYVDLNPQAAQEMVAKTGQMGVPVTEVSYEDAESDYVVGFQKEKLAQMLGVTV